MSLEVEDITEDVASGNQEDDFKTAGDVKVAINGLKELIMSRKAELQDIKEEIAKDRKKNGTVLNTQTDKLAKITDSNGDILTKYLDLSGRLEKMEESQRLSVLSIDGGSEDLHEIKSEVAEWKIIQESSSGNHVADYDDITAKDIDDYKNHVDVFEQAMFDSRSQNTLFAGFSPDQKDIYEDLRSLNDEGIDFDAIKGDLPTDIKNVNTLSHGNSFNMPPKYVNEIIKCFEDYGSFTSLVTIGQTNRRDVKWQREYEDFTHDELRTKRCGSKCDDFVYGSLPSTDVQTATMHTVHAAYCVQNDWLEDSTRNENARMLDKINMRLSYKLDAMIAHEQEGIMTSGHHRIVTTGHTSHQGPNLTNVSPDGVFTWQDFIHVWNSVPSHYQNKPGNAWTMDHDFLGATLDMSDVDGKPIWGMQLLSGGKVPQIAGAPIRKVTLMEPYLNKNVTPSVPVIGSHSCAYGSWKDFYKLWMRRGVTILKDIYTKKGCTIYYVSMRAGGAVTCPPAVTFLKTVPNSQNNPQMP